MREIETRISPEPISMSEAPPKHPLPIPYQVDFNVESKGRHLDSTKRRLKWKFGFAHPPAVFPHLFDEDENYIGDTGNVISGDRNSNEREIVSLSRASSSVSSNVKTGVECRGREHEISVTWSLLSGKAVLWVDNKVVHSHDPPPDNLCNPFSASFFQSFDLPDERFNGSHRIDIRCYARTPMGAKNMPVDDNGGVFRQYDLTVDGLSYFAMPAMFELGTPRMWNKVSRWGAMRRMSSENTHGNAYNGGNMNRSQSYDDDINRFRRMNPRDESEEELMMRSAMEASLKENGGNRRKSSSSEGKSKSRSSSRKNARSSSKNRQQDIRPTKSEGNNGLVSVREDNDLIDFGEDSIAHGVSQIKISRQVTSDVSVLGDDDATTASFMANTGWNSAGAPTVGQPYYSPGGQNIYQNNQMPSSQPSLQPHFQDPTFNPNAQQWSGSFSSNPSPAVTPRMGGLPFDASFASPPPPTWDDYNNAFGGGRMDASVAGSMAMPPSSVSNSMNVSNMGGAMVPVQQQYGGGYHQYSIGNMPPQQISPQYLQSQPFGAPGVGGGGGAMAAPPASPAASVGKNSKFDPLRADLFSS